MEDSKLAATRRQKKSITQWMQTSPCVNPWKAMLGIIPAMVMLVMFVAFPALLNIGISLTDYNGFIETVSFVGLRNYVEFFTVIGKDVIPAFGNTIRYALLVVIPLQFISLGAALLVNKKLRGSNFFRAIFFMPSILGCVVVCASWKLIFDPIDGPLASLGIDSAFLGDPTWSMVFIAIIALWSSFGYSMTIYLAGLAGIPKDYYEAATIDGASAFKQFTKITIPMLWPSLVICLWIAISGTLGMADYIMLTTSGGYNTTTIGFYMFNTVVNNSVNQGQSAATAMFNFIFVSGIMLLYNFFVRKRVVEA